MVANYKTIRAELKAYGGGLGRKAEIIALNKCDALDAATIKKKVAALKKASRKEVYPISAVAHQGVDEVLQLIAKKVEGRKR